MNILLKLGLEHAHACKCRDSSILNTNQVLFGNDARHVLLMGKLSLRLSCLLLVASALFLGIDARFGGFEPLGLDEFCVAHFFILFLLLFHRGELTLFKHLHASLFERLEAEDVEHGLNLFVEVEKLVVGVEDLRRLAVVLVGHLRLEERHRGSVEVKFSRNAHLISGRLICQVFDVLVSLHEKMLSAHDWFW